MPKVSSTYCTFFLYKLHVSKTVCTVIKDFSAISHRVKFNSMRVKFNSDNVRMVSLHSSVSYEAIYSFYRVIFNSLARYKSRERDRRARHIMRVKFDSLTRCRSRERALPVSLRSIYDSVNA